MNKKIYWFGILLTGLTLASGLLHSILYLLLGTQMFTLESFAGWFLVMHIVSLAGSLFLLMYYRYKQYRVVFWTALMVTIAAFFQFIVTYIILAARQLQAYYMPMLILVLVLSMVYGLSLIFSKSGKQPWLKAAGVFIFIIGLVLFVAGMLSQDARLQATIQKIAQWTTLAANIVPVLFILNLLNEVKTLKTEDTTVSLGNRVETMMSFGGPIAFVFLLVFGLLVSKDTFTVKYWEKRNFEKAQDMAKQFEARSFVSSKGAKLQYQFLKPLDYDSSKKYPLIVCLHHGGAHGNDNVTQLGADPAPYLSQDVTRKNYPAFLFVPQCPQGSGWGGIPNYPSIDSLVFETIASLEKEFNIEVKRRYVMGISGGGYGSWHFISTRPKMFAAAIPICGGADTTRAKNIVDVPVWAFHGEKDNLVPVKFSRDMIEAIKKAGGDPKYTEFPGAGHNIWGQVPGTPGLMEWLFEQKLDSL